MLAGEVFSSDIFRFRFRLRVGKRCGLPMTVFQFDENADVSEREEDVAEQANRRSLEERKKVNIG